MAQIKKGKSTLYVPAWLLVLMMVLLVARIGLRIWEKIHPPVVENGIAWQMPEASEKTDPNSEQLLLFDFTAAWCGPCKKMETTTFFDRSVVEALKKHNMTAIRVMDRRYEDGENTKLVDRLQEKYSVYGFPEFVVTLSDGSRIDWKTGYTSSQEFKTFLSGAAEKAWIVRARKSMERFDNKTALDYLMKYKAMPNWKGSTVLTSTMLTYWYIFNANSDNARAKQVLQSAYDHQVELEKKAKEANPDVKRTDDWPLPMIKYLKGELSQAEMMESAKKKRWYESDARLAIGLEALLKNDRPTAKSQFTHVAAANASYNESLSIAKGFLESMEEKTEEKQ